MKLKLSTYMEELRKQLIDFADHLNSYKGFEEVRFDFMVVDYLDKLSNSHKHDIVRGGDIEAQSVPLEGEALKWTNSAVTQITPTEPLPAEGSEKSVCGCLDSRLSIKGGDGIIRCAKCGKRYRA